LSDTSGPPRAVLDSDVIYSRVLHELIGRLAHQERLLTLIWSEELLSEARQTLTTRKQVSEEAAERWVVGQFGFATVLESSSPAISLRLQR
jgi:hypothetical protein